MSASPLGAVLASIADTAARSLYEFDSVGQTSTGLGSGFTPSNDCRLLVAMIRTRASQGNGPAIAQIGPPLPIIAWNFSAEVAFNTIASPQSFLSYAITDHMPLPGPGLAISVSFGGQNQTGFAALVFELLGIDETIGGHTLQVPAGVTADGVLTSGSISASFANPTQPEGLSLCVVGADITTGLTARSGWTGNAFTFGSPATAILVQSQIASEQTGSAVPSATADMGLLLVELLAKSASGIRGNILHA